MGVVRHHQHYQMLYLFPLSSLKMLIFFNFYRTKFLCPHALSYQIINYAQQLINKLNYSKPNFPKMIFLITIHFSHMVRNYTFHSFKKGFHSVHKYEKLNNNNSKAFQSKNYGVGYGTYTDTKSLILNHNLLPDENEGKTHPVYQL